MKTIRSVRFLALAAFISTATAQTRPTNSVLAHSTISPNAIAAATRAVPPTNNVVQLDPIAGEVVAFNSAGFILKTNDSYLPRIALTNLNERDSRVLLESRIVYDALSTFTPGAPRTDKSKTYEARLRFIWMHGSSLAGKIQTRAAILDYMRAYNDALAAYASSVGFASNAVAIGQSAINAESTDAAATSNAVAKIDSARTAGTRHEEHEAWHDYRAANNNFNNDTIRASGAAGLSASMQQNAEIYYRNAQLYADRLAALGVKVADKQNLDPVPALSMRFEVDLDRISK